MFFLSQVNYSELAYERSDYDGEVYRIDMMCDSNTAVDCVFIKLNGVADLTRGNYYSLCQVGTVYCTIAISQFFVTLGCTAVHPLK